MRGGGVAHVEARRATARHRGGTPLQVLIVVADTAPPLGESDGIFSRPQWHADGREALEWRAR